MTAGAVFDQLTGQEAVVEQLQAAAADPERMTHAWLFTGPPGSGRSVAARAFAAALLCPRNGLRRLPVLPSGCRGNACRPAAHPPRRAVVRGAADQGARAEGCSVTGVRRMAGCAVRGR